METRRMTDATPSNTGPYTQLPAFCCAALDPPPPPPALVGNQVSRARSKMAIPQTVFYWTFSKHRHMSKREKTKNQNSLVAHVAKHTKASVIYKNAGKHCATQTSFDDNQQRCTPQDTAGAPRRGANGNPLTLAAVGFPRTNGCRLRFCEGHSTKIVAGLFPPRHRLRRHTPG